MTQDKVVFLGLDIGTRRIGVAMGDSIGRVALPITTLLVDGDELAKLQQLVDQYDATRLVIGLPRNQSGDETLQSQAVRQFVLDHIRPLELPVAYQDESVTSVQAEAELQQRKKPYTKADIDARAAAIILQDYMEMHYG